MTSTQVDAIRKNFREIVRRSTGMDAPSTSLETGMLETTLIRNGSYCGRRFSLQGYSLIWFIDEQQIKLFAQDGSLLDTKSVLDFCGSPLCIPATETQGEFPIRRAA